MHSSSDSDDVITAFTVSDYCGSNLLSDAINKVSAEELERMFDGFDGELDSSRIATLLFSCLQVKSFVILPFLSLSLSPPFFFFFFFSLKRRERLSIFSKLLLLSLVDTYQTILPEKRLKEKTSNVRMGC